MNPAPLRAACRRWNTALATLFAALLLGACSSLPTIVPDMARPHARVQIEGHAGPLTPEQSRAVLDKLQAGGKETSVLERHLAFEQAVVGTPLLAGNKVTLLVDGPRTYKAMLGAIAQARDHINMETYILEDDEAGRQFADALIEKQRAGVQVNLIHDGVGTLATPAAFFDRLKQSGIRVLEYNPVNPLRAKAGWDVNERDHRKLMVIDGRVAILGGINISSVYSGGSFSGSAKTRVGNHLPWRDTDLQIEGPVVAEFQKLFMETWQRQKGDALPERRYFPELTRQGGEVVRAIGSSPDEPYSLIYATLISAITHAESEILLTNAYFVPDPQLLDALTSAARRGVDVKLLLPSKTDSWLVLQAGRASYTELLKAGVKIYERHDALLHSKTALIDGVWVTVGSTNLDWRSFLHNQEINAVVLGPEFGQQMRALFDRDLQVSEPVTLERWRQRGVLPRVQETLSKMWEYWL